MSSDRYSDTIKLIKSRHQIFFLSVGFKETSFFILILPNMDSQNFEQFINQLQKESISRNQNVFRLNEFRSLKFLLKPDFKYNLRKSHESFFKFEIPTIKSSRNVVEVEYFEDDEIATYFFHNIIICEERKKCILPLSSKINAIFKVVIYFIYSFDRN